MRNRYVSFGLALVFGLGTFSLASCNRSSQDEHVDYVSQAKLNLDYTGKQFLTDGIGEVTVRQYIDGDTTHFNQTNKMQVDVRYSDINTPESTAQVQKWGKSASLFTESKLSSATEIVLTNPTMDLRKPDHDNNNRWLALVWYATVDNPSLDDFRLLNLEIVQEGYSVVSSMESYYSFFDIFNKAAAQAANEKLHIYASEDTVDPNFYTGAAKSMTIHDFNFDASKYVGKKVNMTGIVAGFLGVSNVWVESTYEDPETGDVSVWGVSLFAGYDGKAKPLYTVGNQVQFTGVCEEFSGSYQVSGLTYSPYSPSEDDVKLLSKNNPIPSANQIDTVANFLTGKYHVDTFVSLTDTITFTGGYGGKDEIDPDTGVTYTNNSITLYGKTETGDSISVYLPNGAVVKDDDGNQIFSYTKLVGRTTDGIRGVVEEYNGRYNLTVLGTASMKLRPAESTDAE